MTRATRRAESRDQLVIFGTWLIGLGLVFLVREAAGWDWAEAWPLFIVLFGGAGTITAVVNRHWSRRGLWAIWWPLAFLAIGVVLLAATTGSFGLLADDLARWWPVMVIGLGVWFLIGAVLARGAPVNRVESLSIPLGDLREAEVRLSFGGGELRLGSAQPGILLAGQFDGGVRRRDHGPGRIELKPDEDAFPWFEGRALTWDIQITPEIPVDLRLNVGASRSQVDLSTLHIRRLEIHTGASETFVRLPAAGASSAVVEAGVASVNLEVPYGVAARIQSKLSLGSTKVDESRFPRSFDGWASPDYEMATGKIDIEIRGGLGTVKVS